MTTKILRTVCCLVVIFCQDCYAAVDKQLLQEIDLKRGLFSDEYTDLKVGENTRPFILSERTTSIGRGVALLVTDSGLPPRSQQGLAPLIKQLNQLGWVTLLLPVPNNDFFTEPLAEEPTQTQTTVPLPVDNLLKASASPFSDKTYKQHLQQLTQLMQAGYQKSSEYPGFLLVIAQGTSAASLSQLYAEQQLRSPDAFVVVSPYWPERNANKLLATNLANTSMPVLDLYSEWDNNWSLASVSARKIAAVKTLKMQYRQREIIGNNFTQQSAMYITKEIYGWLSRMGW